MRAFSKSDLEILNTLAYTIISMRAFLGRTRPDALFCFCSITKTTNAHFTRAQLSNCGSCDAAKTKVADRQFPCRPLPLLQRGMCV